ncbi:MAG: hypothetical protein ISS53_00390 [Dehalococcoidia bacterium]|nr:hypothetical protein [Dehalococcoidia bacterium]
MRKGTKVTVRTFGDCPSARCIWEEDGGKALVCLEEDFEAWEAGGRAPLAVSLPKAYIYRHEHTVFDDLASAYRRMREAKEESSVMASQRHLHRLWSEAKPLFSGIASEAEPYHSQQFLQNEDSKEIYKKMEGAI